MGRRIRIKYLHENMLVDGSKVWHWKPGKHARALGFKNRTFHNVQDAIQISAQMNDELAAAQDGLLVRKSDVRGSMHWLITEYRKSGKFTALAPETRQSYERMLQRIGDWAGDFRIGSVTRRAVMAFHEGIVDEKKRRTANLTIRVLNILLNHALDLGELDRNPMAGMRFKANPPRDTVWEQKETEAVIAYEMENGRIEVAAAVLVAEYIGLDLSMITRLATSQYDGKVLKLGRRGKTGNKLPDVNVLPALKILLDRASKQAREAGSTLLIASASKPQGWTRNSLSKEIREAKITLGLRDELQFRDLRRTAFVRLIEAGCSEMEATTITGHDIQTSAQILETYGPRSNVMAENAMKKLGRMHVRLEKKSRTAKSHEK